MTGKILHRYRPIAIDANGNKAWCNDEVDRYIDPTNIRTTTPQQFLDEAVYPVTVDPDLGYTAIGGGVYHIRQETIPKRRGSSWTMPVDGTANYIRARIRGSAGVTNDCKAMVNQKDSGGANVHAQITATVENLACAEAEHWEQFNNAGEALVNGVTYIPNIIAKAGDKGDNYFLKGDTDGGAVSSYEHSNAAYAVIPDPWINASIHGTIIDHSIYVNYSEPAEEPAFQPGHLKMTLGLGRMGYDLKTRGGRARRRVG